MSITELLILALASFSLWKLAISDRITQWLRHRLINFGLRHNGFVSYHLRYMVGCGLCFPMWAAGALYFTRQFKYSQWIAIVFAIRGLAYIIIRQNGDADARDLPMGASWPPNKVKVVNAGRLVK